ncbi:protein kinase subdomain-containing protein pkl/ccin9 [Gigaspora margarita]|uniref:Protein kinase subdomain-containing protein pkl/ccin9 n=1 Tax=Gigaspora margarita TaxID=4874 RepID=A0A8H3X710_GIGMA|nr:protein kinase subdomain-containing protein pkl/ccin9 [Gigaspora margarita]
MNFKDTYKEPGKFDNFEKIPESPNIENFAEKLGLCQFTKNKDDLKKFYDFGGSDFTWPSTMDIHERCVVFDYITDPEWSEGGVGKELAANTIAYRKFLESKTLDPSKGTHVLLVHGQIERYGKNISANEYDELAGQGFIYAPITESVPDGK